MEVHPSESPFTNFDTLNELCSFLRLKDKLALGSTNRMINRLIDVHLGYEIKQQGLTMVPDKNERQIMKYNLWRNLRTSKISTVFGKE
jgi:hypothetical protein